MNTVIRRAKPGDALAACQVLRRSITECCGEDHQNDPNILESWLRNKTPDNVRNWLQSEETFAVVAEAAGMVVGFGMSSASGEVILCYVVPEARFTGAGKALLNAIESHAASTGVHELHLESTRTARAFYLRNGFAPSGPAVVAFGMEGQPMRKRVEGR